MDIEDISKCIEPLGDKMERYYPNDTQFYYVGDCKGFRLGSCSDILLNCQLEWSYDNTHKGVTTNVHIATIWRSSQIIIEMPYVRIRIIKNVPQQNNDLMITAMKYGKSDKKRVSLNLNSPVPILKETDNMNIIPEPLSLPSIQPVSLTKTEPLNVIKTEVVEKRHKSPFSRFKRKQETAKIQPVRDPRIPEYLPRGALFYCGDGNSIKVLPRGLPDEVLCMGGDGLPYWKMPYPPVHLSEDSKLALEGVDKIPEGWKFK